MPERREGTNGERRADGPGEASPEGPSARGRPAGAASPRGPAPASAPRGGAGPAPTDEQRRRLIAWLWRIPVLAAAVGAGYGLYEAYRVQFGKERADPEPEFEPRPPVRVAALADFPSVWDSAEFELDGLPALALRLPVAVPGGLEHGGAHYAAFSRICTHQGCLTDYNRDPEAVAFAFNYRSEDPAIVCHCHLSVFAPRRAGEAVSGPAVRPLPRVQLRAEGGELLAVGVEVA